MKTNEILAKSYEHIADDTKFIRLVTITNFVHSLVFVFILMYNIYMLMDHFTSKISIDIMKYVTQILLTPNIVPVFVIVGITLLIWQLLLPPIGEAACVYYLDDPDHKGKSSLAKGLPKFFQLFEYDGMFYFFTYSTFVVFVGRLFILDIFFEPIVLALVVIWWLVVFAVNVCIPYARYIIILEDKSIADWISEAVSMALKNLWLSVKLALITLILNLRFIINIIFIVWIPLLFIYLILYFDLDKNDLVKYGIYITVALLTFALAYINWIIESYFMCMRYEAYKYIKYGKVVPEVREATLFDNI